MTTTNDAGVTPAERTMIATILAILDDDCPETRDRVACLSAAAVDGVSVLEIAFGRDDQRVAWMAFDRLLKSGNQDVQIRVDEHGWTVRVAVKPDPDVTPGASRG